MMLGKWREDNVKLNFNTLKKNYMKNILLILLFQLTLLNISFSQKKITNYTQYFKEYSNNFKWNNFSFKSDFKNYYNELIDLSDDEKIIYQNIFLKTISDSLIVYKFDLKPIIQNIEFDDVFLNFGENSDRYYFQNLNFVKYFNSDSVDEQKNYYLINLEFLTKKFGVPVVIDNSNIWQGSSKLFFNLSYGENAVALSISLFNKAYLGSLKQKFDYFFTSEKFKEIDKAYSFRGIKFGSTLEFIKSITRLTKTYSDYEFVTKESKYLNWNSIYFSLDGTHFGFTKDKKLSEVILLCDYNDEEGYNKLREKLIGILGSETIIGNFISWTGDNISIYMNNSFNSNDQKDRVIIIKSNLLESYVEKDY